jgi:uncharacterized protein (DUF488 family)
MFSMHKDKLQTPIWTIGHSNHPIEYFLDLLQAAKIRTVADVRSSPRSRFAQFNQAALGVALGERGIRYTHLGHALGGRPDGVRSNRDGWLDYELMARQPTFTEGVDQVLEQAKRKRVALLCSEHEPIRCHRCILIGRLLAGKGVRVRNILRTGEVEPHDKTEDRLLALHHLDDDDLLESRAKRLNRAYRAQEDIFRKGAAARLPTRRVSR